MRHTRLIGTLGVIGAMLLMAGTAAGQGAAEVPRNRTLVSQGWDFYNQVPSPANFNPYAGVLLHQRNSLHYTVNEMLFYTNHNTGKIVPWQGESWAYNPDFTVAHGQAPRGVKWSDGAPFTARGRGLHPRHAEGERPDPRDVLGHRRVGRRRPPPPTT